MKRARKEQTLALVGVGMALLGAAWFGLALLPDALQGMVRMFGFPLGAGLALGGLIVAGVYYWRRRKILKLTESPDLLAQWSDELGEVFIAADSGYIHQELHLWQGRGARLDGVALVEHKGYDLTSTYLEIEFANLVQGRDVVTGSRMVWKKSKLSIRVPQEKLPEAARAVAALQARVKGS